MLKKILIGISAGFISGFFASGGGLVLLPALIYILKCDEVEARATALFCILPMVVITGIVYVNKNFIDWDMGLKVAIGGFVGGIIGTVCLKKFSVTFLKCVFIIFLLYSSYKMLF